MTGRNQPSEEALRKMIRFLLKTSVPRILEEQKQQEKLKTSKQK